MYSDVDLKELLGSVPADFADESKQFWTYVEEKLALASGMIYMVCLLWNEETIDTRAKSIIEFLENKGAKTLRLEDSTLLGEARAWLDMSLNEGDLGSKELHEESNRELSRALNKMLDTLADMKVAVVFADPACRPVFPEGLRVIKMAPSDPEDYLRRHKIRLRLAGKVD
jgi:hypothetical protein